MIDTLNSTCAGMRRHVDRAQQETVTMLEEASQLLAAKREAEIKQGLLDALKQHFVISDDDLTILTSSAEAVNDDFFNVLRRVQHIYEDCKVLLGSENQRLGLELMEQTSRDLDVAFNKLYGWIQREFKSLDLEDPHISGSIRRALRVLSERPAFFQKCLDYFTEAREHSIAEGFHIALTQATGNVDIPGSSKPIEFSTHDLPRYIGDMLAWVHSSTVSEKEALKGLFVSERDEVAGSIKAGTSSEPWSRFRMGDDAIQGETEPVFDGRRALNDLVNRNLRGVSRALRQRVELAIRSAEEPVVVYKAHSLLTFFHDIFAKLVGTDAILTMTVRDLQTSTFSHVEQLLQDTTNTIPHDRVVDTTDLRAPDFLTDSLDRLISLAKSNVDTTSADLEQLLSVALVPCLNQCAGIARHIDDTISRSIFTLNYVLAAHHGLSALPACPESFLHKTSQMLNEIKDRLAAEQHEVFLHDSGLDTLLGALDGEDATQPPFNPASLGDASAKVDEFLPSALMNAQDSLKQLSDKALSRDIIAEAALRFCADFDRVEAAVELMDEDESENDTEHDGSGRLSLRDIFPRTGAELRVLLS